LTTALDKPTEPSRHSRNRPAPAPEAKGLLGYTKIVA